MATRSAVGRTLAASAPAASTPAASASALEALAREAMAAVLDEAQMQDWAERLADALPAGAVLALHGELGAGKTTLVRALCARRGVLEPGDVTSPTFAILHEYPGKRGVVLHADLYRLRSEGELDQLGWDELIAGADLVCVEWPERAADRLPSDRFELVLAHVPERPNVRSVELRLPQAATVAGTPE